jgi:hypothetical protein
VKDEPLFVLCDCGDCAHQALLIADIDDKWGSSVCLEYHLSTYKNIFKRIWVAIKYVFGYRSKYGEWDEIIINPTEVKRIRDFLARFLVDVKGIKK